MKIRVVCAIIEKNGTFLAARRRSGMHQAGLWEFPGGKVEPQESDHQALNREIAEELSLTLEIGPRLGVQSHDYGDGRCIELVAYRARIKEGSIRAAEHDRIRWVDRHSARDFAWAPADLPLLDQYLANLA